MNSFDKLFHLRSGQPLEFIYYAVAVIALLMAVYTDLNYSEPMPSDMRNRVVGARMMKDGLSPYFYIWQKGGPIRYYDIHTEPNLNVSRVTATPFFHQLMEPIADMPQAALNTLWMFIEYAALGGCALLALCSLPVQSRGKVLPLITAIVIIFMFTVGWRIHVFGGQNYIFIALLATGCFYCMRAAYNLFNILLFALFAASLILVYPVAALMFAPFAFYMKRYFKYAVATLCMVVLYAGAVAVTPVLKTNWAGYFKALPVHAGNHLGITRMPVIDYDPMPIKQFEGINLADRPNEQRTERLEAASQFSNFFYFYNVIFHKRATVTGLLVTGAVFCIFLLLPLLIFLKKKIHLPVPALFILGFVMYNTYTFFTPIIRCDYHFVTFLFPFLILAVWQKNVHIVPYILLVSGLVLNIAFTRIIPAQHNVGEFLIVTALLFFVYRPLLPGRFTENKFHINNWLYLL